MDIKVMNRIYRMSEKEYKGLLEVAGEQVSFGIYAVERKGYAELMNIKCKSKRELKKHKRELKQQGFKVYANGIES